MGVHVTKYEKDKDGKIRKSKRDGKTSKAASENSGVGNQPAGNGNKQGA